MGGQASQNDLQAKLIRVVYLLIPLFNIPPLFITAKESFIQMYAEFRYQAVSARRDNPDASTESAADLISGTEYCCLTVALLVLAVALSIVLDDVGTVSSLPRSVTHPSLGLLIPGLGQHHAQHSTSTTSLSTPPLQVLAEAASRSPRWPRAHHWRAHLDIDLLGHPESRNWGHQLWSLCFC